MLLNLIVNYKKINILSPHRNNLYTLFFQIRKIQCKLQIDVSTLRICRNMTTSMIYDKLINYLLIIYYSSENWSGERYPARIRTTNLRATIAS